jgi:hypothetical protein
MNQDPPLPRRFNLKEDALPEKELTQTTQRHNRQKGAFIAGPFPMAQFRLVARLPGKASVVWQLIHYRLRVSRMKEVTLPDPFAAEFGLTEWVKRRAIKQLEHIGLVRVNRRPKGKPWLLSLVELSEDVGE